jgi:cation:H+ antiporter
MQWLNPMENAFWLNVAIFVAAAVVVWAAGGRVAYFADLIAERTGWGRAFVGALLLATAASLPEIGSSVTAAATGNAELAVNSLFGEVITLNAALAILDWTIVRGALTVFMPRPVLLLQGVLLVTSLGLTLAGVAAGEFLTLFGIGLWPVLLAVVYVLSMYLVRQYERDERWEPKETPEDAELAKEKQQNEAAAKKAKAKERKYEQWSLTRLAVFFCAGACIILIAGITLALVSDALVEQTGLAASFFGVAFLGVATALPEISALITTAHLGNYDMAVSDVFGSNAFVVGLVFLVDLAYRPGPVLEAAGSAVTYSIAVCVVMTSLYLAGMIERRDYTILDMGIDSATVVALYIGSLVIMYMLR